MTNPVFSITCGPRNHPIAVDFTGYVAEAIVRPDSIQGFHITCLGETIGYAFCSRIGIWLWNTVDNFSNRQFGQKMISAKDVNEAVSCVAYDHYTNVRNGSEVIQAIVDTIPKNPRFPGSMVKDRVRSATFGRSALVV